MATIKKTLTLAASAENDDILSGTEFSTLPWPARVSIYGSESVAGFEVTFRATGEVLMDAAEPNVASAAGITNTQTDQMLGPVALPAGTRLLFKAVAPAAGGDFNYLFVADRIF